VIPPGGRPLGTQRFDWKSGWWIECMSAHAQYQGVVTSCHPGPRTQRRPAPDLRDRGPSAAVV